MARAPGVKDVNTQPFYDSGSVTSATTSITLFQQPKGQGTTVWGASGGKTLEDTNMVLAGQLPSGWAFTGYTVQFQPAPDLSVANAKILFAGGALQVNIGAKSYLEIPLIFAAAGAGISGQIGTQVAAASNEFVTLGTPGPKDVFGLGDLPMQIGDNENFNVTLTWGTLSGLSGTVKFRVLIGGQLTRGVQ